MSFPKLKGKFLLAPMSGVSDVAFRVLCKRHGAAMTYTEFCSADGIVRGNVGTTKQAFLSEEEDPVGIQLFGSDANTVKEAAKLVQDKATVVDFNMGCPAWHVLSQGCGSALLQHPEKIESLVREVSQNLEKPFTVKLRLGLSDKQKNFVEVAQRCVDAGAVAVALHGRTTKQGYSGKADWSAIKELKESVDVPVIGNGDIFSPEDAVNMLDQTGCDYAMLGRGAKNNPFIFTQANQLLQEGAYDPIPVEKKLGLFQDYLTLAKQFDLDFFRIKQHALSLSRGLRGATNLRTKLSKTKTIEEVTSIMDSYNV